MFLIFSVSVLHTFQISIRTTGYASEGVTHDAVLLLAKERIEGITKNVNDAKNAEAEDVDVDDEVESDVDEEVDDIDDDKEEGSLTLTQDVADNRLAARPSDKFQKPSIDIVAETSKRQQHAPQIGFKTFR